MLKQHLSHFKKNKVFFIPVLLPFLFFSCNDITVGDYVLDNSNSDNLSITYQYWAMVGVNDKGEVAEGGYLEFENTSSGKKKLWIGTMNDFNNKKGNDKVYFRFKKLKDQLYLLQFTSYDKKGERSIILQPVFKKNDDEYLGYELKNHINWTKQHPLIKRLGDHVKIEGGSIEFDGYAANLYTTEIITFIKELDKPSHYDNGVTAKMKGFKTLATLKKYIKPRLKERP